ncbi:MAG TPA: hypothetical protein VFC24_16490, partial [Casimicrobiaceae bacterium]|nr:hypothetical protein [Casimicrobiaceae bacterium]
MKRAVLISAGVLVVLLLAGAFVASRPATLVWITDHVQSRMGDALRLENVSGSLLGDIHVGHLRWQGE